VAAPVFSSTDNIIGYLDISLAGKLGLGHAVQLLEFAIEQIEEICYKEYLQSGWKKDQTFNSLFSPREMEVLNWWIKGYSARTIAEKLSVSYETVKTHINRIYQKLGVSKKDECIAKIETLGKTQFFK